MNKHLNEILWEFTLKCNKNCCYCGSMELLNKNTKDDIQYKHEYIANQIVKVHPDEVTITGGEPSIEFDKLIKCVKILYDSGIKVKILTNGHLFEKMSSNPEKGMLLDKMVSCYGLSINELSDFDSTSVIDSIKNKITIITNFGTHNFEHFNKIAKFVIQYNCWQVQLTIGNEYQLDLDQIKELDEKVKKLELSGLINVVRADNFTCGKCKAGIYGFSITYDGLIIPCLSYRSWKSNIMSQGTVKDIENIWENGFKFNRERTFVPSCKTISGIENLENVKNKYKLFDKLEDILLTDKNNKPNDNVVFVYGVANPSDDKFQTFKIFKNTNSSNCDDFIDGINSNDKRK